MATATAAAPTAISQNLLFTLPPPTRSDFRGRTGGEYPLLLTDFQATRFRFGSESPAPLTMEPSRSGGTGRRAGLKIRFPPGSVGSIPTFGTSRSTAGVRSFLLRLVARRVALTLAVIVVLVPVAVAVALAVPIAVAAGVLVVAVA